MNSLKRSLTAITCIIFILLVNFSNFFAQEKPEAILIDNFGLITNCEDILVRMDYLINKISESPGAIGYIVIYGAEGKPIQNIERENLFEGNMNFRGFDKEKLIIIRGKEIDQPRAEFWLVPNGANKPHFESAKWNLTLDKDTKPFIYFNSNEIYSDPCPSPFRVESYSEFLRENLKARANIVIYESSNSQFEKQKNKFIKEIVGKHKISLKRIRFFYVREKTDYEKYEIWLLP